MANEKWLPVVDFEGLYHVSNFGNVVSDSRIVHDVTGRTRRLKARFPGCLERQEGTQLCICAKTVYVRPGMCIALSWKHSLDDAQTEWSVAI